MRIVRGNVSRHRHQKTLKLTKGYRGSGSKLFRVANQQKMKALRYAYIDRRQKKRSQRRLWICRINATVRQYNISYGLFISGLKVCNISVNRKWLSQISVRDPKSFYTLVHKVTSTNA